MPTPTETYTDELADLDKLAAELKTRGLLADIRTPHGRLPHLDVQNPRATVLTERVYAQADSYWFSWCERIAGCDQVTATANILVRILRTLGEETETR
jgi:hypothetical protein